MSELGSPLPRLLFSVFISSTKINWPEPFWIINRRNSIGGFGTFDQCRRCSTHGSRVFQQIADSGDYGREHAWCVHMLNIYYTWWMFIVYCAECCTFYIWYTTFTVYYMLTIYYIICWLFITPVDYLLHLPTVVYMCSLFITYMLICWFFYYFCWLIISNAYFLINRCVTCTVL